MVHNIYSRNIYNFFTLLIMQLVGRPKIWHHRCPPGHAFDKESNKCDLEENVDMEGCKCDTCGTSLDILAQCKDLPDRSFIRDDPDCSGYWLCRHYREGRFELISIKVWLIISTVEIYAISSSFL